MKKLVWIVFVMLFPLIAAVNCFAEELTENLSDTTYINEDFMYTISVSEDVYIQNTGASSPDTLLLKDASDRFSAIISCDKIDDAMLKKMRNYINDFTSPEEDIFNALVKLKTSQFSALKKYYNNKYLYPDAATGYESNMKIFSEGSEDVFGVPSNTIIYNTIEYNASSITEQTHINIIVPAISNRVIYTFSFLVPKGNLDISVIDSLQDILDSVHISNLQEQTQALNIFKDLNTIKAANRGIYPVIDPSAITYDTFENKAMGYKMSYPSTFIPYLNNNIINTMQYNSFRIDPRTTLSILSENVDGINNTISNKVYSILEEKNTEIINVGVSNLNEKKSIYIEYKTDINGLEAYVTTYFLKKNSVLYTVSLESKTQSPSNIILEEFNKIIASLEFTAPQAVQAELNTYVNIFTHKEKGYGFVYPSDWNLTNISDAGQGYNKYSLKKPGASSTFDIVIYEDELNPDVDMTQIYKLAVAWSEDYKKFFKSGFIPYEDYVLSPIASSFSTKNDMVFIYKLFNYPDENNQSRYGYSVCLIKDNKVYTMFISTGDYLPSVDQSINSSVIPTINMIVESFSLLK